jgi:hypothetical protein
LGPWLGYIGKPIGADQIPVRELTGGYGQVRGNVQKLTASRGWSMLGKRGTVVTYRQRTEAGGGAPSGGVSVPVVGVPKGGGEVARELLHDDVVLMVCLAGAKRQ